MSRDVNALTERANCFILEWLGYLESDHKEPAQDQELMNLLGCAYVRNVRDESGKAIREVFVPEAHAEDLPAARKLLPVLLKIVVKKHSSDGLALASLLHGIYAHELLADILRDEDAAYALAAAILLYIECYEPKYPLDPTIAEAMCKVLNAWLASETPWRTLPPADTLAQHFFGDSRWLFIDGSVSHEVGCCNQGGKGNEWDMIGDMVTKIRPPFLPGLCPLLGQWAEVALPNIQDLA